MAGYEIIDGVGIIPDGVTVIEREAFEDRKDLKHMIIPDTVTEIGRDAFNGCSALEDVVIPA